MYVCSMVASCTPPGGVTPGTVLGCFTTTCCASGDTGATLPPQFKAVNPRTCCGVLSQDSCHHSAVSDLLLSLCKLPLSVRLSCAAPTEVPNIPSSSSPLGIHLLHHPSSSPGNSTASLPPLAAEEEDELEGSSEVEEEGSSKEGQKVSSKVTTAPAALACTEATPNSCAVAL